MFSKLDHESIKKLENHHKDGEISGMEIMLFVTITRFAWWQDGKLNPCKHSASDLGGFLGRSEAQIKRSLVRLKNIGAIRFIYRTQSGKQIRETKNERNAQKRLKRERPLSTWYEVTLPNTGTGIPKPKTNK